MWNVLWVQQGQSFSALDLPDSARSNLHSALESEVGNVLGGRRGRALPQSIEEQLGELVTSTSRPRGEYKKLIERVDSLRDELESLRSQRRKLADTLDQLEAAQETLARLSAGDRDQEEHQELDEARKRHRQLAELEARIQAVASDLELKNRNLEQAMQAEEGRRRVKDDIATGEKTLEAARKRLEAAREQDKQDRSRLEELRAAVHEAERAVTKADEAVSRNRRIVSTVHRAAQIRELQDQCEKAQAAEKRQRDAQQGAAVILVTGGVIEQIRTAAKGLEAVTNRLSAAATLITFDIAPERLSGIEIDGAPLTTDQSSLQAVAPATITIPERGRITIEPAIKDRDTLISQQREAKAKLKDALGVAGAATVNDSEDQYARRQKMLQQAELARQEAELHAPATDEHEAGAQALADYIESLRQILAREVDELALQELPAYQEAETASRNAQEQATDARHALANARAALSGPEEALGELQTELGTVSTRYEDGKERLTKFRRQLEEDEKERSDDELQAHIEVARTDLLAQEKAVTDLQAQRTDETLLQLEARTARFEKAIEERRNKRESLKVKISGLRSHVEVLEGVGLDEAIQQKSRELELYEEERKRFEREVKVLTLLLSTLRVAEQEAKERYLSPVLNRVRPYLQLLFPGADITIDENLHISGVVREAGYEEAFHHLSMGTQEQIAVLVRLAFAEMLVEQGHPATVVLDDALVFSDDRRMSRMFDILNRGCAIKLDPLYYLERREGIMPVDIPHINFGRTFSGLPSE